MKSFKLEILIFLPFVVSFLVDIFNHSHKKRKDSLEGSLDQVLLAAELEFPKKLVPKLPQHKSDVNIECGRKSEWTIVRKSEY